jgi:hypothetical protein
MFRFGVLAPLLFGWGVHASELPWRPDLPCRPEGIIDTTLDFLGKSLIVHNLGGRGVGCQGECHIVTAGVGCECDEWDPQPVAQDSDPPILRFANVGIAGNATAAAGKSFDLVIENLTAYEPWTYRWVGVSSEFGGINLAGPHDVNDDPTSTKLRFCAVESGKAYTEHLVLDVFPLTFYDLCAPSPLPSANS